MTQTTAAPERTAGAITRHWRLLSGLGSLALVMALGLVILLRENAPFEFDGEWMEEVLEERHPLLELPAQLLNFVGGGWFGVFVVPVLTVVVLLFFRRRWAALYYLLAASLSAGLVQLLKHLFNRPRPEDILVAADLGSFPSGHVANAATIAVALGVILSRIWIWAAGAAYVVVMALSRTYLGAHWVSDTIGGALLGAGIAVIVWTPFALRLGRERELRTNRAAA